MKRSVLFSLFIILLLAVFPAEVNAQCAMCKAVVESTSKGAGMLGGATDVGEGLNKGIIFLMVIPYVLLFLLFRKRLVPFFKEMSRSNS